MKKDKNYRVAAKQDPEGVNCAFCGKVNDFWDADGWFYLWTDPKKSELEDGRPACKACVKGKPGKQHEKLHGKGDGSR